MDKKPKKMVPEVRFKGFTDDWEQRKLGEIFSTITDYVANGSFKSLKDNVKTYDALNYAYMIRLMDASNNWKGPWLYTDKKGFSFLKKTSLKPNDILLSNVGAGVGKTFLVPKLNKPMTLAPNAVLLRSSQFEEKYLYYLINTSNNKNKILSMVGVSAQPKINKTDFKKVKVKIVLQRKEELKIGELISRLDELLSLQQKKLKQLKLFKKAMLQQLFVSDKNNLVPNIRFSGFNSSWKRRKLEEVVTDYKEKNNNNKLPVLTSSVQGIEYQEKHFGSKQKHDVNDYNILPKGYITYRNRSDNGYFKFNINNLGVTGIVSKFYPVFSTKNTNKVFLTSYINNNERVRNHFKVVSVGTSQHVLSLKNFKKTSILFSSEKEQNKIGNLFIQIDNIITLQQSKINQLLALKKYMLQKLFV